jgi:hypothetical protein
MTSSNKTRACNGGAIGELLAGETSDFTRRNNYDNSETTNYKEGEGL